MIRDVQLRFDDSGTKALAGFFIRYVREVAKSSSFHRHISMSVCLHVRLSVRMEQFVTQDGFFVKFCILVLYQNLSSRLKSG